MLHKIKLAEVIRESTPLVLGGLGFALVLLLAFTGTKFDSNQLFTLISQYITGSLALSQSPDKRSLEEERQLDLDKENQNETDS